MLEKKLAKRLKQEFSKSFISDKSPTKNRMQSLLTILKLEKQACHMRSCDSTNKARNDNSVETSLTGVKDHVRGGGGHRGMGGRRGQGRQGQGRGKEQPGNSQGN